jgi:hypothetical protein
MATPIGKALSEQLIEDGAIEPLELLLVDPPPGSR